MAGPLSTQAKPKATCLAKNAQHKEHIIGYEWNTHTGRCESVCSDPYYTPVPMNEQGKIDCAHAESLVLLKTVEALEEQTHRGYAIAMGIQGRLEQALKVRRRPFGLLTREERRELRRIENELEPTLTVYRNLLDQISDSGYDRRFVNLPVYLVQITALKIVVEELEESLASIEKKINVKSKSRASH